MLTHSSQAVPVAAPNSWLPRLRVPTGKVVPHQAGL